MEYYAWNHCCIYVEQMLEGKNAKIKTMKRKKNGHFFPETLCIWTAIEKAKIKIKKIKCQKRKIKNIYIKNARFSLVLSTDLHSNNFNVISGSDLLEICFLPLPEAHKYVIPSIYLTVFLSPSSCTISNNPLHVCRYVEWGNSSRQYSVYTLKRGMRSAHGKSFVPKENTMQYHRDASTRI